MRRAALTVCVLAFGLALCPAAGAHPSVAPPFVTAGQRETVTFVAANERQARQTGFSVTVPPALTIVAADGSDVGWEGAVHGSTVHWTGCCLAPGALASFSLELQAHDVPGDVPLEVFQLYRGGERVRWLVNLTVLPGEKESGSPLTVLLVAGLGLLVTVGLVVLVWLRRT